MPLDEALDRYLKKCSKGSCFNYSIYYTVLFGTVFTLSFTSLVEIITNTFNLDISRLIEIYDRSFCSFTPPFMATFLKLAILTYPAVFLFAHSKFASKYVELNHTYNQVAKQRIEILLKRENKDTKEAEKHLRTWDIYKEKRPRIKKK
jgi:hypothetical protein